MLRGLRPMKRSTQKLIQTQSVEAQERERARPNKGNQIRSRVSYQKEKLEELKKREERKCQDAASVKKYKKKERIQTRRVTKKEEEARKGKKQCLLIANLERQRPTYFHSS
ncbi:hypothetical protein ElyMa_000877900 [Elysia marginata]|uniref:Coiled-coil domain-containing protein 86 n=1 Tax=Elysia marginata TaxID=1093978 RepID=A0AAV4H7X1_9GAST|nr:hypothetical protein ElyMa_000877900 [Elysia marginata]